ncbi:Exocyst complex component 8 [Sparganum proliferum]
MADVVSSADAGLKRLFNKPNFNADKFIARVSQNGGTDILHTVQNLNRMTDEASSQMKQAIYKNFKLFIEAGKAVTSLGATMHQLDNQLLEQKRILKNLTEKSLFPDITNHETSSTAVDGSSTVVSGLSSLLHTVDGISNLISDPNRHLLFEADAIEVNSASHLRQGDVHLFLLSDYILVAKAQEDSFEHSKYQKQALYEIENISAVNVKASSQNTSQNLVKLLVFPDYRLFQFESIQDKRAFLVALEEAKRLHVSGGGSLAYSEPAGASRLNFIGPRDGFGQGSTMINNPVVCSSEVENACFDAIAATIPDTAKFIRDKRPFTTEDQTSGRHKNPFHQDSAKSSLSRPGVSGEDAWLFEIPEDIDVSVAVRDFAQATQLISKARHRIAELVEEQQRDSASQFSTVPTIEAEPQFLTPFGLSKLADRIEQRSCNLSLVLEDELVRAAEGHGAVRSVQAAVLYLSELGKTVLAMHLFLTYRSGLMNRTLTRGVRQEGNQLVYINRLSLTFHRQLVETVTEWNQLIDLLRAKNPETNTDNLLSSKLCSWILEETVKFGNHLRVILVDSRSVSFYCMAYATERVHAHSSHVTKLIGIDLRSTLDNCLLKSWQTAAEEQLRVYKDALELRASKETWQGSSAFNSGQTEANLKVMTDSGFSEARQDLSGGQHLTNFTAQSSRALATFVQACSRFGCPALLDCFAACLAGMLEEELGVYRQALSNPKLEKQVPIIRENLEFFMNTVIVKLVTKLNVQNQTAVRTAAKGFKKLLKSNA